MSTIIDPELTVRLGALDADEAERIQNYATAAFLWRGLRQDDALDVARALHWRAVGRELDAAADEVIDSLALGPIERTDRQRLTTLLDIQSRADHGSTSPVASGCTRPNPADFRRVGRRLAHALALLDTVERAVA